MHVRMPGASPENTEDVRSLRASVFYVLISTANREACRRSAAWLLATRHAAGLLGP